MSSEPAEFKTIKLGKPARKKRGSILKIAEMIGDELDVQQIPEKIKRGWDHDEIS